MIEQDPIATPQHQAWWEKAIADPTKRILILEYDRVPIAVITFFGIDPKAKCGWWGFYMTDQLPLVPASSIILWQDVERSALRYAFEQLQLQTLLCETRETNEPVLLLHDRFGFETLAPDGYPNALKHRLVVKQYKADQYVRQAAAGMFETEFPLDIQLDDVALKSKGRVSKIAFLASSNWSLVANSLNSQRLWTGEQIAAFAPEFGQYRIQLRDPESSLRTSNPDYVVFAERIEDFIPPQAVLGDEHVRSIAERFSEYLQDIREARAVLSSFVIVHDFEPVRPRPTTFVEQSRRSTALDRQIEAMNAELHALILEIGNAEVLPISHIIADLGRRHVDFHEELTRDFH